MANEIYTTTRDGLAALVSRHVADEVLGRAVVASGSDPDRVDASLMSRLLRGRVRRALERTLPRAGVRRHLADLDARIAGLQPAAAPAVADATEDASASETPAARPPAAPPVGPAVDAATRPAAPAVPAPEAPPAGLLDRLGDLEAVRQWIWAPDGRPATGRGSGPDPERARRLLAPIWTVLDRQGAVRSVHVHHGHGHVLIGRAPGAAFAVAGDPDLNLGAIYAAFRALEEEP